MSGDCCGQDDDAAETGKRVWLVWAKDSYKPWWPAKMIRLEDIADDKTRNLLKRERKAKSFVGGSELVEFFENPFETDYAWIKPSCYDEFQPDEPPAACPSKYRGSEYEAAW